jgi:hypothetical protein
MRYELLATGYKLREVRTEKREAKNQERGYALLAMRYELLATGYKL